MKKRTISIGILLLCIALRPVFGQSDVRYYYLPLRQLEIEGQWPDAQQSSKMLNWRIRQYLKYYIPYAVGDHSEEIYVDITQRTPGNRVNRFDFWQIESVTHLLDGAYVAIKADAGIPPSGTVYLPKPDLSGMTALRFKVPKKETQDDPESQERRFYTAMKNHYDFLRNQGFTGTAWFRYRADLAGQMLKKDKTFDPNELRPEESFRERDPFDEGMSLLTGTMAVSENIQLDRTLQTRLNEPRTEKLSAVEGITTAQIDWKGLVAGEVKKDSLARYIPADQHVLFFPTFESMTMVMDNVKVGKDLVLPINLVVNRMGWYEQQMCVWMDDWTRIWGPKTVRGVAMTGSDPYMQAGTDVAILFDTSLNSMIYAKIESKQQVKLKSIKGVKKLTGRINDVDYQAVVSPDRAVCSYLAAVNNVVVVTNSLAQLEKIVRAAGAKEKSVADLDEYAFFRSRYPVDKNKQTAFMMMSDAAIRRWCSPQWRIGAARRTMAAAILSQLQAEYLDKGDQFDLAKAQRAAQSWAPDIGKISITEAGITSSAYGNLQFMTPIIEHSMDTISKPERDAYRRFRQNYQRQWQLYFDPIAVSLFMDNKVIDVDLTVRPLIAATAYRQYLHIAGDNKIQSGDGDIHPQSLLQFIMAIDTDSDLMRQMGGFAMQMMNQDINALGWLGRWITLYADEGSFWKELSQRIGQNPDGEAVGDFVEKNINRLPLAIEMDVENSAKLTLFLVSLRAFIQQTAPDMTAWETLVYNEKSYVKVNVRYDEENSPAVYYAILPNRLIVSLHEDLIKRAMDRSLQEKDKEQQSIQWLGENMATRVDEKAWPVIEMLVHEHYARYLQMQAWNCLPILNEWHSRKKEMSETAFHERYWHTKPIYPGGGEYTWNPVYQAVTSSVFGNPANPLMPDEVKTPLAKTEGVQLGITFEADGLRAKTILERGDKK